MPQPIHRRSRALEPEGWLAASADADPVAGSGAGLASSPIAVVALFVGWVTVGLVLARFLAHRGHDARTMGALGAGLGPLMAVLTLDAVCRRDPGASPLVLLPGRRSAGGIDVVVLVQGAADRVADVLPMLEAVRPDLRSLTVARAVAYEWLEGDLDNDVVRDAEAVVRSAARLIPLAHPSLVLMPGTQESAGARFVRAHEHALVLVTAGGHRGVDRASDR